MKRALPVVVGSALCFFMAIASSAERVGHHIEPIIDIPRFSETDINMKIDGVLDEAIWASIPAYDGMLITDPDTMETPPYKSHVRYFYTNSGLYVGGVFEQPAGTLIPRLSGRDFFINRDEFGLSLDTSGEGLYGYWFTAALGGSVKDGKIAPERNFSNQWDGPWLRGTAIVEQGWSTEMFLPWSMMAMPKIDGPREMGFWANRQVAHRDERWSSPPRPFTSPQFLSVMGKMRLEGVEPGRQLSLFPFVSYTFDDLKNDSDYRAGMDIFWRPSTNFQATATIKPDFGAVESDDVIVNLSAFETFFSEKRRFFVEGNEVFVTTPRFQQSVFRGYGGSRQTASMYAPSSTTLVNTRRIGSAPDLSNYEDVTFEPIERGRPSALLGAAKLTGQAGSWRYGLLAAFEDDVKRSGTRDGVDLVVKEDGREYGVVRLLYERTKNGRWSMGYLGTLVRRPQGDALVHGIDTHFLSPSGKVSMDTQWMLSDVNQLKGFGVLTDISYTPNNQWKHSVQIDYVDTKLNINDFGFLRRNDNKSVEYKIEHNRTKGLQHLRRKSWSLQGNYVENSAGEMVQGGIFGHRSWTFNNRSQLSARLRYFPSRYDDLNSLGNGSFKIKTRAGFSIGYGSDTSLPISYSVLVGGGKEDLGKFSKRISVGLTFKPTSNFSVDADILYRRRDGWLLHQVDRNFTTFAATEWQPRVEMDYFINSRHQLRLTFQWAGIRAKEQKFWEVPILPGKMVSRTKSVNAQTDDFTISRMSAQLRYRWEIGPLSDLFVVYTRGSNLDDDLSTEFSDLFKRALREPLVSTFVVKVRYRFGS